jgi:Glycosyl transferase family 2
MTLHTLILVTVITLTWILLIAGYVHRRKRKRGHGISLLVPFRTDNGRRAETWEWLDRYWRNELPGAQIIIGTDDHTPFCKTAAVNNARRHAKGDVLVILDADCYVAGDVIESCAAEIRRERKRGNRIWFVPYRCFYRLNDLASRYVMSCDPSNPIRFFAFGPKDYMLDEKKGVNQAHWFGALIQILPKEAFDIVGGMDTRFYGWGGEDVAYMHALDTLYAPHKTSPNGVIHLWHPTIGTSVKNRRWPGQDKAGHNGALSGRYHGARGDYSRMLDLVNRVEPAKVEVTETDSQNEAYGTFNGT